MPLKWEVLPPTAEGIWMVIEPAGPPGTRLVCEVDGADGRTNRTRAEGIAKLPTVADTLDWVAQTVHRAHHDGELESCLKTTCQAAREALAGLEWMK